ASQLSYAAICIRCNQLLYYSMKIKICQVFFVKKFKKNKFYFLIDFIKFINIKINQRLLDFLPWILYNK
ncbi:MAG: hypothetical protein K2H29_08020, partial [Oscillospiraceae bacterium]|nr:hypothetical protein [Oscillospiraceae bacterium]